MDKGFKQLGYAILKQALKDYFTEPPKEKRKILKDLQGDWMDWLTNGLSLIAAKELQENPGRIRRELGKWEEELEVVNYAQAN